MKKPSFISRLFQKPELGEGDIHPAEKPLMDRPQETKSSSQQPGKRETPPSPQQQPDQIKPQAAELRAFVEKKDDKNTEGKGRSDSFLTRSPLDLGRKEREDVASRFQEGFRELGSLLKNVNDKLSDHNETNRVLVESVKPLPKLLDKVTDQLEEHRKTSADLRDTLSDMRDTSEKQIVLMKGMGESHKLTVDAFQQTQTRALNAFYRAQKETYEAFKKGQANQSKQFESAILKTQKSFTRMLMIFLAVVMIAATGAVIMGQSGLVTDAASGDPLTGSGSRSVEAPIPAPSEKIDSLNIKDSPIEVEGTGLQDPESKDESN